MVWDMKTNQVGAISSRVHFLPDLYDMRGVAYPE